jgi:hypothetical protein
LDAPQASAFQRLGESALSGAGVVSNEQGKNFFLHPVDTLKAMAKLQGELGERAGKELANKDYVRGLTHGVEWLIPGLGPTLAHSGDQLESGDTAGGVGTTLGAAATLLAGAKAPAIAEGAANIADAIPGKAIVTAPVRAAVRATEAVANSKLKPFAKLMTPADEAAGSPVKLPGRDFGLPAPAAAPGRPAPVNAAVPPPATTVPQVAQPEVASSPAAATATPAASDATIPRTLSGDAALREVLTTQPNKILLQIARSRGVDVTPEAQLKPTNAVNNRVINKIITDFSDDELDDVRSTHLEVERMGRHDFGDVGKEASQTLNLQTYFPDLKIPLAQLLRLRKAITTAGAPKFAPVTDLAQTLKSNAKVAAAVKPVTSAGTPEPIDDLTQILQESLKQAQQKNSLVSR